MPSKKYIKEFGPIRKRDSKITQHHKDMAASLQKLLEEVLFIMLNGLHNETKSENLCMAGGVALNSVANGKILKKTKFKNIYIQPAASDAGGCVGAAFYAHNCILKKPRKFVMNHSYWGPSFSTESIQSFLDNNHIIYKEFTDYKELTRLTAKLLHTNNVIGWFHGRMEWGPRALGNRSILSNPCNPDMQNILNRKVKHREHFRPFAPVITVEDIEKYFLCDNPVPLPTDFMLMVYPILEEKRDYIPSVVHVDGSGRLQSIRKEQNPLYYGLIKEFEKYGGVPILINTSFNIRGEPIVCTPQDAYKCMMGTGIDYLVMDRFLIKREDNPKDMWDSEKCAID